MVAKCRVGWGCAQAGCLAPRPRCVHQSLGAGEWHTRGAARNLDRHVAAPPPPIPLYTVATAAANQRRGCCVSGWEGFGTRKLTQSQDSESAIVAAHRQEVGVEAGPAVDDRDLVAVLRQPRCHRHDRGQVRHVPKQRVERRVELRWGGAQSMPCHQGDGRGTVAIND